MRIKTKWFGEVDTDDNKIITFEKGLIGFEDHKKFAIVYDSDKSADSSVMWLQSLDDEMLALPVIKPEVVYGEYDPIVEDELINSLGENIMDAELAVVVVLTVPADITNMTCNLKAPIIINVDTMKAVQVIADNEDYMVRFPIYDVLNNKKGGE